jgi:hypothetical protein
VSTGEDKELSSSEGEALLDVVALLSVMLKFDHYVKSGGTEILVLASGLEGQFNKHLL